MQLTEHIAEYLRANGFKGATSGQMPEAPDRIATVYATGVRRRQDDEPSRFEIIVRSDPNTDNALNDAFDIVDLLDDFCGITSTTSPFIQRIRMEGGGVSNIGVDGQNRVMYSINFECWYC